MSSESSTIHLRIPTMLNSPDPFTSNWLPNPGPTPATPISQNMTTTTSAKASFSEYSIFVGDVAPEAFKADLLAVFRNPILGHRNDRAPKLVQPFHSVKSAKIILDPVTGVSKEYGFVRFTDRVEQQRALVEMNGVYCLSRPMRILPTKSKFKPAAPISVANAFPTIFPRFNSFMPSTLSFASSGSHSFNPLLDSLSTPNRSASTFLTEGARKPFPTQAELQYDLSSLPQFTNPILSLYPPGTNRMTRTSIPGADVTKPDGEIRRFKPDPKAEGPSVCIGLACPLVKSKFVPVTHRLISRGSPLVIRRRKETGDPVKLENGELLVKDVSTASWGHAQIWCQDEKVFIQDIGSGSGTWLNDRRLVDEPYTISNPYEVVDGDIIRIGHDLPGFTLLTPPDHYKQMPSYTPLRSKLGILFQVSIFLTAVLGRSDDELQSFAPPPREPLDLFRSSVDTTRECAQLVISPVTPLRDLTGHVDRDELQYIGGGSFGDVYRGKWTDAAQMSERKIEIVIKVLRSTGSINSKTFMKDLKALRRELAVWQSLDHQNIVPFVGISLISGVLPAIISRRMCNGTLRSYLEKNPCMHHLPLLIGVARGLNYLHSLIPVVIHGDLKADNVLIDEDGSPRLCDFGLSRMVEESSLWQTSASTAPGTLRWKAPELLNGDQRTVTVESDMYAYGMTCLEAFIKKLPFQQYRNDWLVLCAVVERREIPERPSEEGCLIDDDLWLMLVSCWKMAPASRPSASEVIRKLVEMNRSLNSVHI